MTPQAPTMRLTVKFFGLALKAAPGSAPEKGVIVEMSPGSRITDLLKMFGLAVHRNIVTVQGKPARWNTVLEEGQVVQVVGPPGGG